MEEDNRRLKEKNIRPCSVLRFLLFAGVIIALSPPASAEVFQSKFLSFRLPDGWKCKFEDQVFTCQPPVARGEKLSMIIILAAKLQGEHDSLPEYMTQLRKPGVVDGPKIDNDISKVAWVEATLFESELKGYYTKYLATVWDGIAILVTFSVHKDSYAQFQSLILPCIRSLELKSDWKKK
ncbi:MAG: hypothetical protein ABSE82_17435 [Nitrososphaerales archaeon]